MRFYFDSSEAVSRAVLLLVTQARSTTEDFSFGPLDLKSLLKDGLSVVGASDSLLSRLSKLPGVLAED